MRRERRACKPGVRGYHRRVLSASALLLLAVSHPAVGSASTRDLSGHFPGFRATVVARDVSAGTTVRHDPESAAPTAPCSTFEIPNSVIGLETGVLADASTLFRWDGQRREVAAWNRDHDLRSAIRDSVVWYYQELARRVGSERMRQWLGMLRYGNQDISGGLDHFWLGSSLRISPDEQVAFLERLLTERLPVSPRTLAIVKEILVQEPPAPTAGLVYRGRTAELGGLPAPQSAEERGATT